MNPKRLLLVLLLPTLVLLIPGAAMLFSAEGWKWSPADFIFAWLLMASVGLCYLVVTRKAVGRAYRVGTGVALATGFLLIWINGAVGLIGSEHNPANALYLCVLAMAAVGAGLARLEPLGMSRALFTTALAQFCVPIVALIFWRADFRPGVSQVFALNTFFVLMFAVSALLFRLERHRGVTSSPH
jgi:hypothetical protein